MPLRWSHARVLAVAGLVVLAALAIPGVASAYDEPHNSPESHAYATETYCGKCHRGLTGGPLDCTFGGCHAMMGDPDATYAKGPHGSYSSSSKRCSACHGVHDTVGDQLLPGATITATCFSCHDGTGGRGVYGAIKARTGVDPAGMHRIDTTNTIPGGDGATGGPSTMTFRGVGGTLSCTDCHSPHDTPSKVVNAFRITRWRSSWDEEYRSLHPGTIYRGFSTSHLLRRNPGSSTATATDYGSDWCLACHAGRLSGGSIHNHPVDSRATTTTPFTYGNVALLASDDLTSTTTMGPLAVNNRGFLMPYPRTSQQGAHKPVCQQCHGNARDVGSLSADGTKGDAMPSVITTPDGFIATDNPRFQNFPHETASDYLLVENDDDLCLNCHPPAGLP